MNDFLRLDQVLHQYRLATFAGMLVLSMILAGCRTRTATVSAPKPNAQAQQYLVEGDAHFLESHLYGWRQAESLYRQANDLTGSEESREKLLLTRFLIMTRQIDEDIPYLDMNGVIQDLCAENAHQQRLCAAAEWYQNVPSTGNATAVAQLESRGASAFKKEDPALDAYLNVLFAKAKQNGNSSPELENAADKFEKSPLSLYLNPKKILSMDPAEFERDYPQFAEAFEFMAESMFQKKKYGTARAYFKRAIGLIPDYTRSITGLGNIYCFALEDYERALSYYDSALKWDPASISALFGKGLALHELERYQESNAVLDGMLAVDPARYNRIGGASVSRYYQGEAHYLRAYNHYLINESARARTLVDLAKALLPDAEEINYLSGVLYYQSGSLEPARRDFLHVIERGNSNCNALLHLGLIYQQMNQASANQTGQPVELPKGYRESWRSTEEPAEKKALDYFLGAGSCMESAIRSMDARIESVNSMELDSQEKIILKDRLNRKRLDMRISSCSSIEMMIAEVSQNGAAEKPVYLNLLKEILSRLRIQPNGESNGR